MYSATVNYRNFRQRIKQIVWSVIFGFIGFQKIIMTGSFVRMRNSIMVVMTRRVMLVVAFLTTSGNHAKPICGEQKKYCQRKCEIIFKNRFYHKNYKDTKKI